jgi:hypothetical protein
MKAQVILRFRSKFDRWVVAALVQAAFSLGLLLLFVHPNLVPLWVALLPWAIWIYVLAATLPQHYEIRPEGLCIR